MAKRVASLLGVRKTRLIKRTKKKKNNNYGVLLRKVIEYLKSDCYMFAPLFSYQSSDFNATGVDTNEPFEDENNRKLAAKVGEYLKSDSYMYAPLLLHQPSLSSDNNEASPQTGPENVAVATITAEKATEKRKLPAKRSTNILQESDGHPVAKTVVKHTVSYRQEAVKHIVHQHCRSSSVTGTALEITGSRNVVVE